MGLPIDILDDLIDGVFEGRYTLDDLPLPLYLHTANGLDQSVIQGFGAGATEVKEVEKAFYFKENVSRFSGAKTFQEVRTLSDLVFQEDGSKRPYKEFRKLALAVSDRFDGAYLDVELDEAFAQSQNARKWIKFEREQSIFPLLKYVTVGDLRVRPSHKKLDGIIAPVNDPIWRSIMPMNGRRCRCIVIQLTDGRKTSKKRLAEKTEALKKEFKKNPYFAYNAGLETWIFREDGKGKHNYFKVPAKYEAAQADNFDFPSMNDLNPY